MVSSGTLERRRPVLPNGVLGMLIFVLTELMLFTGMVSAFMIVKASQPFGWPPPDQPRLPIEATGLNSLALFASGLLLYWAGRKLASEATSARAWIAASLVFGMVFVGVQGAEWVGLIAEGLTLTSGPMGAFFYLIVGCHALHAVAALLAIAWALSRSFSGKLDLDSLRTVQVFWFFVVGVWPILYIQVYL